VESVGRMKVFLLLVGASSSLRSAAAAKAVPLATFDGAAGTTWPWQPVNDPVMGGASSSKFRVDSARALGVWEGEVRIVPFLGAPGFCNLQAPGLYKEAVFPDISGTDGLTVRARQTNSAGLTLFNAMLMTSGAKNKKSKQGVYNANFTLSGDMEEHFLPYSAFKCSWRGQSVSWCPDLASQLAEVTAIGVGTVFPGVAGKFQVELASVSATAAHQVSPPQAAEPLYRLLAQAPTSIDMATFDGKAKHTWKAENDPIMGGVSESSFVVDPKGFGDYKGTCRIVPFLHAPGFTIALTEMLTFGRFPDVSSMDGLVLGLKNVGGNISNFKFAFCDSRIIQHCKFQVYKADFALPPSDDFSEIFLPWAKFSDKWSAYTGEHTAENPPKAASLRSITQLQLWTEGEAGDFHVQLKYIRAAKAKTEAKEDLATVIV